MTRFFNVRRSIRGTLGVLIAALPALSLASEKAPAVQETLVKVGNGLALETLVIAPEEVQDQALGVIVMSHGFLLSQQYYRDILAQIAQEGFVVIAPQAYPAGGLPLGKPTTEVEAAKLSSAIKWFSSNIQNIVQQPVDFDNLGLVSHSRGSKVAWTMLRDDMVEAKALAAIDPVDGTRDGSGRVTAGDMQLDVPALIIGTGLGGKSQGFLSPACAPTDSNYSSFWPTAVTSPSFLYVAKDYGHMDFLDEDSNCGFMCSVCASAPKEKSRPDFRNWISSKVSNFMRAILYKDQAALGKLKTPSAELIQTTVQSK